MRWAHHPDEVPLLDPSRGADPFWPFGRARTAAKAVRAASRDLGGRTPPPAPEWMDEIHVEDHGKSEIWTVEVPNYPRLVRVSSADTGEKPGPVDPLGALAGLSQVAEVEAFMSAAADLASTYGALGYGMPDATLHTWRSTARELQTHLLLLMRLSDVTEFAPGTGPALLDASEHRELTRIIMDASRKTSLRFPAEGDLLKAIQASLTPQELQVSLASMYWGEFQRQLRPYAHPGSYFRTRERPHYAQVGLVDVGDPGQIVARCGSRGWAFYELWRLARENRGIRQCQGCGRLFEPRRKDARHCRDSCRVRTHRRRNREPT